MVQINLKESLTNEIRDSLIHFNNKRIKINGTVKNHTRVLHDDRYSYIGGHYEHYIKIKDVKIDLNRELKQLYVDIIIPYNRYTSKFKDFLKDDNIEFFIKIEVDGNDLYAERPTKIRKII